MWQSDHVKIEKQHKNKCVLHLVFLFLVYTNDFMGNFSEEDQILKLWELFLLITADMSS